ncbi:Vacuolar protein sorting-associated protein 74 [Intoshia linei]|uniref:Vacuolar protein sorting-associated protein 74 n=1 Tax=Intoshia linei TaxID=1819745 RepID=A0A177B6X7_9BILA|nr:Vacuolar protein sorting-associated protein 74 [Intoshia linei]
MRRRNVNTEKDSDNEHCSDNAESVEETLTNFDDQLSLMEQILLMGLKEKEGYTPAFNESISFSIRAAILIELGFCNRIEIVKSSRSVINNKIKIKSTQPTGNILLDEAVNIINSSPTIESVTTWIEYLNGDSWNPLKMMYQLRNVRERVAKSLSEKGICSVVQQNFFFFDTVTHPVVNRSPKQKLHKYIQEGLLNKWQPDIKKMPVRLLALIILANAADVLDDALNSLQDNDYSLVIKRLNKLITTNFQELANKDADPVLMVLWSVVLAVQ